MFLLRIGAAPKRTTRGETLAFLASGRVWGFTFAAFAKADRLGLFVNFPAEPALNYRIATVFPESPPDRIGAYSCWLVWWRRGHACTVHAQRRRRSRQSRIETNVVFRTVYTIAC
jgi:hypothetical protein